MQAFSIEGKNISKEINHQAIIKNMSMNFPNNSIILIEGKNGSGKSVTLKMLANIMQPTSGLLSVKGNISYAPDHLPMTINLTVKEYLDFIDSISIKKQSDIKISQLTHLFNLESFLPKRIHECSKGTQQKVNLIQCLIKKADIYIMDEPFSGLDKNAIAELKSLLIQFKQFATIVLTSHEQIVDYTFVTHRYNIEQNHLIDNSSTNADMKMLIKIRQVSEKELSIILKEHDFQMSKDGSIIVNSSQSNQVIALLIHNGYFIEEVRRYTKNGVN